jgi:hypothetical protein
LFSAKTASRQHSNSELLDASEVPDVVRDDGIGRAAHRQKKLVARVGEEWPDPEVNSGFASGEAEGAHDGIDG